MGPSDSYWDDDRDDEGLEDETQPDAPDRPEREAAPLHPDELFYYQPRL